MLAVGNHRTTFRDSDIQIFLNGEVLLNGSRADSNGTLKLSHGRKIVFKETSIIEAWRSGLRRL